MELKFWEPNLTQKGLWLARWFLLLPKIWMSKQPSTLQFTTIPCTAYNKYLTIRHLFHLLGLWFWQVGLLDRIGILIFLYLVLFCPVTLPYSILSCSVIWLHVIDSTCIQCQRRSELLSVNQISWQTQFIQSIHGRIRLFCIMVPHMRRCRRMQTLLQEWPSVPSFPLLP